MKKITIESLPVFKALAAKLKPYTEKKKHSQGLEMLAILLGYTNFDEVRTAELSEGEPVDFSEVVARLKVLLPETSSPVLENLAVTLNLHVGEAPPIMSSAEYPKAMEGEGAVTPHKGAGAPEPNEFEEAHKDRKTMVLQRALKRERIDKAKKDYDLKKALGLPMAKQAEVPNVRVKPKRRIVVPDATS